MPTITATGNATRVRVFDWNGNTVHNVQDQAKGDTSKAKGAISFKTTLNDVVVATSRAGKPEEFLWKTFNASGAQTRSVSVVPMRIKDVPPGGSVTVKPDGGAASTKSDFTGKGARAGDTSAVAGQVDFFVKKGENGMVFVRDRNGDVVRSYRYRSFGVPGKQSMPKVSDAHPAVQVAVEWAWSTAGDKQYAPMQPTSKIEVLDMQNKVIATFTPGQKGTNRRWEALTRKYYNTPQLKLRITGQDPEDSRGKSTAVVTVRGLFGPNPQQVGTATLSASQREWRQVTTGEFGSADVWAWRYTGNTVIQNVGFKFNPAFRPIGLGVFVGTA